MCVVTLYQITPDGVNFIYRIYTKSGCEVRLDVLEERRGELTVSPVFFIYATGASAMSLYDLSIYRKMCGISYIGFVSISSAKEVMWGS